MAKKRPATKKQQTARRPAPSDDAVMVRALRREKARLQEGKRIAKQLATLDDHLSVALVQTARAVVGPRGWSVVRTEWLRELEDKNQELALELQNLRTIAADAELAAANA